MAGKKDENASVGDISNVLMAYGSVFQENTKKARVNELPETDLEFETRFKGYIEKFCVQKNMKPSLEGFCAYLGIDIQTYKKWKNGVIPISERRHFAIEQVNAILLACLNEFTSMGKINTVYAIFVLKNNFGYEDKQVQVAPSQKKLLGKQKSNEDIEKILASNSGVITVEKGGSKNATKK